MVIRALRKSSFPSCSRSLLLQGQEPVVKWYLALWTLTTSPQMSFRKRFVSVDIKITSGPNAGKIYDGGCRVNCSRRAGGIERSAITTVIPEQKNMFFTIDWFIHVSVIKLKYIVGIRAVCKGLKWSGNVFVACSWKAVNAVGQGEAKVAFEGGLV